MAKKDDFDFEDFDDADAIFGEETDDRNPSTGMVGQVGSSFIDSFSGVPTADTVSKTATSMLPSIIGEETSDQVLDTMISFKDQVEESATYIRKSAKPLLKKIKNSTDSNSFIGSKIHSAINYLTDDDDRSRAPSKEQLLLESIVRDVDSALGSKDDELTKQLFDKHVEYNMAMTSDKKLAFISAGVDRINIFNDKVMRSYFSKSLELQYRHLYVSKDSHEISKLGFDTLSKLLTSVIKNTALPDFLKLRSTEALKQKVRNSMITSITESAMAEGTPLEKALASMKKNVNNVGSNVSEMVSGISDMSDMAPGDDMGISKSEMAGDFAGDGVKAVLSRIVGKEVRSTETGRMIDREANDFILNPGEYFESKADGREKGWKKSLLKLGAKVFKSKDVSGVTSISKESRDSNAMYTIRTDNTINNIIPEYLSKILKEVSSIRTGRDELEMKFDRDTGELVDSKKFGDKVYGEVSKVDKDFTINSVKLIKSMNSVTDTKLTTEETDKILERLAEHVSKGGTVNSVRLSGSGFFEEFEDSNLGLKARLLIKGFTENSDGTINQENATKLNEYMASFKRGINSIDESSIERMISDGKTTELTDKGFIKYNKETKSYDMDMSTIRKAKLDTIKTDSVAVYDEVSDITYEQDERIYEDSYIKKYYNKFLDLSLKDAKSLTSENLDKFNNKLKYVFDNSIISKGLKGAEKKFRVSIGQHLRIDYRPDHIGGIHMFYGRVADVARTSEGAKVIDTYFEKHMPDSLKQYKDLFKELITKKYAKVIKSDELSTVKLLLNGKIENLSKVLKDNENLTVREAGAIAKQRLTDNINKVSEYITNTSREDMVNDAIATKDKGISKGKTVLKKADEILSKSDKYKDLKEKEESYRKEMSEKLGINGDTKENFVKNLASSKKKEFLETKQGKAISKKYSETVGTMTKAKAAVVEEITTIDKIAKESLKEAVAKENGEESTVEVGKDLPKSKIAKGYNNLVDYIVDKLDKKEEVNPNTMPYNGPMDPSLDSMPNMNKDYTTVGKDDTKKTDEPTKSEVKEDEVAVEELSVIKDLASTVNEMLNVSKDNTEKDDTRYEEEQKSQDEKDKLAELDRIRKERQDKKDAETAAENAALDRDGDGKRDGSVRKDKDAKPKKDKAKDLKEKFKTGGLLGLVGGIGGLLMMPFKMIGLLSSAISGVASFAGFGSVAATIGKAASALRGVGWVMGKGFEGIKHLLFGLPTIITKLGLVSRGLFDTIKGIGKFVDKLFTGGKIGAGATGAAVFFKKLAKSKWSKAALLGAGAYALFGGEAEADGVDNLTNMVNNIEEHNNGLKNNENLTEEEYANQLKESNDSDSTDYTKALVTTAEVGSTAYVATKIAKPIIKRRHGIANNVTKAKNKAVNAGKVIAKTAANLKEMKDKKIILDTLKKSVNKNAVVDKANSVRKVVKNGKTFFEAGIMKGKTFTPLKAFKKMPGLGIVLGAGFAAKKVMEGDFIGAAMELGAGVMTSIPFVGIPLSIGMEYLISERDEEREKPEPILDENNKPIPVTFAKDINKDKPEPVIVNKDTKLKVKEVDPILKAEENINSKVDIKKDTVRSIESIRPKPELKITNKPKATDYRPADTDLGKRDIKAKSLAIEKRNESRYGNDIVEDVTIGESKLKGELAVIAYIVRSVETNNKYGTVVDIGDGAGISFGAYQFTMSSGSLGKFLDNYIKLKPLTVSKAKYYRGKMKSGKFTGNTRRLSNWLKMIAKTKHGIEAQDNTFVEHYYNNAIKHIPKNLKSIEAKIHVIDAYHNGGGAYVASHIRNDNIGHLESVRIAYWKQTRGWTKYKNGWLNRLKKIRHLIEKHVYNNQAIPDRPDENLIDPPKNAIEEDELRSTNSKGKTDNMIVDAALGALKVLVKMLGGTFDDKPKTSRPNTSNSSNSTSVTPTGTNNTKTKDISVKGVSTDKSKVNMGNGKFTMLGKKVKTISEIPHSKMNGGKINNVTIHCTYTNTGSYCGANCIDKMHKQRGWSGCGYHFLVLYDGSIEYGRNIHIEGAHVEHYNTGNIGISYAGGRNPSTGGNDMDACSKEQLASLIQLSHYLAKMHSLDKSKIVGHKEFPKVAKSCPNLTMANVREASVSDYSTIKDSDSKTDNGIPEKDIPVAKTIDKSKSKPSIIQLPKDNKGSSTRPKASDYKVHTTRNIRKKVVKAASAVAIATSLAAADTPMVQQDVNIATPTHTRSNIVNANTKTITGNSTKQSKETKRSTMDDYIESTVARVNSNKIIATPVIKDPVVKIDIRKVEKTLLEQLSIQSQILKEIRDFRKDKHELNKKDKNKDMEKEEKESRKTHEIEVNTSPLVSTKSKV